MNTVPEEIGVPDEETQLEHLRQKLLGNQIFRVCRGRINGMFNLSVEASENPTQFCQSWDEAAANMRVMGNLLAQYKRDGWMFAHNELRSALTMRHIITGETVPLEETTPITVVMFDPARTFLMLRWLASSHWMKLNEYLEWKDGKNNGQNLDQITKDLFAQFPDLEKFARIRHQRRDYEGPELCEAYEQTVLNPDTREIPKGWIRLKITYGIWNDHIEIGDQIFAYMVPKKDQAEVLSSFSREEQKLVGTWQVNYPSSLMNEEWRGVEVGFHEESEHEMQSKFFPAFTSKGIQGGMGVRLLYSGDKYPLPHFSNLPTDRKFRISLDRR